MVGLGWHQATQAPVPALSDHVPRGGAPHLVRRKEIGAFTAAAHHGERRDSDEHPARCRGLAIALDRRCFGLEPRLRPDHYRHHRTIGSAIA
jgi:hypothetical protein